MSPASILATKFAQAKASISQRATERKFGMTRLSPSSMPPYPAHRPICVIVLVVSTLFALLKKCREFVALTLEATAAFAEGE